MEVRMNRRLEKKKAKKYISTERTGNWQCDKCGWDSKLDPSTSNKKVTIKDGIWKQVHCTCPICRNVFSYIE